MTQDDLHRYELTLELPAVHRSVRLARSVVRRFSRMWGMSDEDVDNLMLVVSELLANTIDHGVGEPAMTEDDLDGTTQMGLNLVVRRHEWTVRVTDQGGGDAEVVRGFLQPDGMPDLEDERGRGFFLLSTMVDRIDVETSRDGKGLTISATKKLA